MVVMVVSVCVCVCVCVCVYIYIYIPVSQFILLSLPCCIHMSILYICISYTCPGNRYICTIFSKFHEYGLIYVICSSLSDLPHSVWQTLGPSTPQQMTQFHSFLSLSNIPYYFLPYLFIHLSVCGNLGCHVLAIVNGAAMNTGVHVFFWIMVFSGYMPSGGISGSYGSFIFSLFKESSYYSPQYLYQFTFPPIVQEASFCSTPSPAFIVYRFFDDDHFDWCQVI